MSPFISSTIRRFPTDSGSPKMLKLTRRVLDCSIETSMQWPGDTSVELYGVMSTLRDLPKLSQKFPALLSIGSTRKFFPNMNKKDLVCPTLGQSTCHRSPLSLHLSPVHQQPNWSRYLQNSCPNYGSPQSLNGR